MFVCIVDKTLNFQYSFPEKNQWEIGNQENTISRRLLFNQIIFIVSCSINMSCSGADQSNAEINFGILPDQVNKKMTAKCQFRCHVNKQKRSMVSICFMIMLPVWFPCPLALHLAINTPIEVRGVHPAKIAYEKQQKNMLWRFFAYTYAEYI